MPGKPGLAYWPVPPYVPPMPDLSAGRCTTGPLPAAWWLSEDPAEREAARHACHACPVLAACREWALSFPARDNTILAGMTRGQRQWTRDRERAARGRETAAG